MLFKYIQANKDITDKEFDKVYPSHIRSLSDMHFTSVKIAKLASAFLSEKNSSVLDIGAGVGKFCMIGSVWTGGQYVGVEQRAILCDVANQVIDRYRLNRVEMINSNILNIPFGEFNAFYFFNAFHENLCKDDQIDQSTTRSQDLYIHYSSYVREELDSKPKGTRLVTYHSYLCELPNSYNLKYTSERGHLKFWERT
jgi:hypothetical protein